MAPGRVPPGSLTPIQVLALRSVAGIDPPFTLTGGAALGGFHLGHRATRDLDLFWNGRAKLDHLPSLVIDRLRAAGLEAREQVRSDSFHRIQARAASESLDIDLVANPTPQAEPPEERALDDVRLLVDTRHQILVNKLCAILSRTEVRDLVDLKALLDAGGDLPRGLADANRQDGGFSPLTFSWGLRSIRVGDWGAREGLLSEEIAALERFRDELVAKVVEKAQPT